VYHLYLIRTARRDEVLAALHEAGIGAGIHYPIPLHHQPAYRADYSDLSLPVSEQLAGEILSLPLYPELSEEKIVHIADTLIAAVNG
jgi:dTDP-4-amino-4,6-dideoxygalactose transaminase